MTNVNCSENRLLPLLLLLLLAVYGQLIGIEFYALRYVVVVMQVVDSRRGINFSFLKQQHVNYTTFLLRMALRHDCIYRCTRFIAIVTCLE